MVHDPASSLRTGDVISISSGWRVSKNVHHVVRSILAPFGEPIEARPPVPTEEQRMAERVAKSDAKMSRKRAREDGLLASKSSYTPEELQAIKERREAKLFKSPGANVPRTGEEKLDKLRLKFMNHEERVEYCKANNLPIPEEHPGVKEETVAKVPVPPPSPEELQMLQHRRQQKREERARLYQERTGQTMPDWQILGWMNTKERNEWREKNPQTYHEAVQAWLSKRETTSNVQIS
jgi:hypothetical protein